MVSCLKFDLPPAPVAAVVRFAVPVTPPAPVPLPVSVSMFLLCWVGVPVLPYSSDSLVVWLTFMLAYTSTCALPGPSVCASIPSRLAAMLWS